MSTSGGGTGDSNWGDPSESGNQGWAPPGGEGGWSQPQQGQPPWGQPGQPQWGQPGQQPGQQWQAPPYGQQQIPNYLPWAIVTTVLCCMPFGIVSIVYAAQVNSKQAAGDIAGAMDASKKARTWAIVAAAVGGVIILGYVLFFVAFGLAGVGGVSDGFTTY